MRHPTSKAVFAYWNMRRGARPAPLRREIDPAAIRSALPSVFILETDRRGHLTFRLAGTGVCALFGRELKGKPFSDLWLDECARPVLRACDEVLRHGRPVIAALCGESLGGRSVDIELLLMPLATDTDEAGRILGVLEPLAKPGWLHLDPMVAVVTTAIRFVDIGAEIDRIDAEDRALNAPFGEGSAEDPAGGFQAAPRLSVIAGGRID
jgi:hypothetical protein